MKQTPLILSIIALVAVAALGIIQLTADGNGKKKAAEGEAVEVTAKEGAIVWYDLDRVLNEYDMANDLRSVVETKVQSIQDEINRRGNKLQSDVNKFQSDLDKGVLIRSVAEQRNQKLQQQQASFNNFSLLSTAKLTLIAFLIMVSFWVWTSTSQLRKPFSE